LLGIVLIRHGSVFILLLEYQLGCQRHCHFASIIRVKLLEVGVSLTFYKIHWLSVSISRVYYWSFVNV